MKLKINLTQNIIYYSFIISIFLHICFFTFGSILSKSKKETQFQKLTFVTISENIEHHSTTAPQHYSTTREIVEKEVIPKVKDIPKPKKEENIKKQEEIKKPFSPFEVEKSTHQKVVAGGVAEILKSISEDKGLSNSQGGASFVVQDIPKGEGEGIGLGGKGSGIGVGGDDNGIGMKEPSYVPLKEPSYVPPEPPPIPKIDKEKILKEYITKIVERIEKNKRYPDNARSENIEGKVRIKFVISKDGKLKDVEVLFSSGYKILDDAAIFTIKIAQPFPPIPNELEKENFSIKLNIVFKLEEGEDE